MSLVVKSEASATLDDVFWKRHFFFFNFSNFFKFHFSSRLSLLIVKETRGNTKEKIYSWIFELLMETRRASRTQHVSFCLLEMILPGCPFFPSNAWCSRCDPGNFFIFSVDFSRSFSLHDQTMLHRKIAKRLLYFYSQTFGQITAQIITVHRTIVTKLVLRIGLSCGEGEE